MHHAVYIESYNYQGRTEHQEVSQTQTIHQKLHIKYLGVPQSEVGSLERAPSGEPARQKGSQEACRSS